MADADDVRRVALALPGVEEIDSDGFDFRVGGKGFVWSYPERRAGKPRIIRTDIAVLFVGDEAEKQALLLGEPGLFFTAPGYGDWPLVLLRLPEVGAERLAELVTDAWRMRAPATIAARPVRDDARNTGARIEGAELPGTAPSPADITAVQRRLRASQGAFVPKPVLPIIDEIIATVLSQHTSDINSERAFAQLKDKFPTWEQVADTGPDEVAGAIRCGGIADQKARRIQQILTAVEEREGRLDLSRLNDLDDASAETYLLSLPGVGPKTAACVLVFSMGRAAFPVDTHVHRVAIRLGWVPPNTTADKTHQILAPRVPPAIRYDLHVALIAHGRTVCRAQRPRCEVCVVRDLCDYGSATGAAAGR